MESKLDLALEIKSGFRYLHIKDILSCNEGSIKTLDSRGRSHTFKRSDFNETDWSNITRGACLSVRVTDWKISEINLIGSG